MMSEGENLFTEQDDQYAAFPSNLPPPPPVPAMSPPAPPQFRWETAWDEAREAIFANHPCLSISVSSPELAGTSGMMSSKYVTYAIRTEPLGHVVHRRYNDFAWLRDSLVARFHGLFVPALPATSKLRGATQRLTGEKIDVNGEFVKNRTMQLHMFAQQLCRIPFLRTDPALLAFLSAKDKDWKAPFEPSSAENTSEITDEVKNENPLNEGLQAWYDLLDNFFVSIADAGRSISECRRQLEIVLKTLEHLEKEAKAAGRRALQFVLSANSLQEQFLQWQKAEMDLLDPNLNEYVNAHGARVRTLLTNLTLGQLQWTNNAAMIPQILARVILSSVQYQIVQVEHFIHHLLLLENTCKELERAEREKSRALEDKNKAQAAAANGGKRGMFSKAPEELEEIYLKKTDNVNTLQRVVDRMTKAMIYCEIDRFNQDRVKCIHELVGSLSVCNLELASSATKRWTEVVNSVGIDTSKHGEIVDMLQHSLEVEDLFAEAV